MGKRRGRETVKSEESGQREGMEKGDGKEKMEQEREQQGGGTGGRLAEWLLYVIFSPGLHEAGLLCPDEL